VPQDSEEVKRYDRGKYAENYVGVRAIWVKVAVAVLVEMHWDWFIIIIIWGLVFGLGEGYDCGQ
jgi:hypothetical protein